MENQNQKETGNIKEAFDRLKRAFNDIFIHLRQMDLEEIIKLHSEKIDEEILKTVKSEGWKFIGGIFTITYVTEKTFSLTVALYYQDRNEEIIEKKAVSPRDMKFLKPKAVEELRKQKKIEYNIDEPSLKSTNPSSVSEKE